MYWGKGPGNIGFTESIKGRLAIGFMVLAILPVLFLGFMAYWSERAALEDRIKGHLTSIADIQKSRVISWLGERASEANFIASDYHMSRDLDFLKGIGSPARYVSTPEYQEISNVIGSIKRNHDYLEGMVLDQDGRVIVSTDPSSLGKSMAGEGYFKGGLNARLGGHYIQDIYMDSRHGLLAMAFAAPIKDYRRPDKVGGVAVIVIGMDRSFYPIFAGWPGMGRTGDTLILRREGGYIVFLSRLRFMEDAPLKLRFKVGAGAPLPALYSSSGREGLITTTDYRGVKVLAAYRYIPEMKWGFVVKEDYDEVFASANELKVRVMAVVGVTLLFLFVLIYLVSTRIAEPIVSLSEMARRITGGDFSVSLPVRRRDEVGSLASSFNDMASSLLEYRKEVGRKNKELEKANKDLSHLAESLEEKVHARTLELENLNRALLSMMEDLDERTTALEKYQEDLKLSARDLEDSRNRVRENLEIVERANVELRRIDRMKDHFLGMMSHELRTPLSLITGYSSNLLSDPSLRLERVVEEGIEGIYRGAERLRTIVTEMLDVSQIDAKGLRLVFAPSDIGRLVSEVLRELGSFIAERKQQVVVGDGSSLPHLNMDNNRMRQVLVNILGNAIKFTPDGGRIEISFEVHGSGSRLPVQHALPEGEYVEIVVKDSGIGIDSEELVRIFEKFYEVGEIDKHATSKYGFLGRGVGLGLPIARGIIEAHGGRLWAQSGGYDPEKCPGSSFHILLPVSSVKREWEEFMKAGKAGSVRGQAGAVKAELRHLAVEPGTGLHRSILVIDDDADILALTVSTLEREYNVHGAADGRDGIEKARRLLPDLILLDVYMEGMNGYEVCGELKKDEKTRHIPIAMFTAGAQRWEVERGYEAGADYYVTKPFKPSELLKKVGDFISGVSEPVRFKVD